MVKRRTFLEAGLAAGGAAAFAKAKTKSSPEQLLKYLCPPENIPDQLAADPSPAAEKFKAEVVIMPIMQPVEKLDPPPDPAAHQRYEEFKPKKFYEIHETEFKWQYHPDPPYDKGTWSWGFNHMTPGPTYHARYGEPVLVRRFNDLPPVGQSKATFALPSTTNHLHNGHTASESDGNPQDWIDSGEFWDHHYANFPSGFDHREKLTTLWYHDHRLDFTAANVYAGLSGFYLLFDERDTGNENDTDPKAWRLPSGEFDVPLMIHDVKFDQTGQVVFNGFITDGWLGDKITINRKIYPFMNVKRRKYRFRIVNGGPSRFYKFRLSDGSPMCICTGDGNFLPKPVWANHLYMSVAQRVDVIIDFSKYKDGDVVDLENLLEQTNGKGPSGRTLNPPDAVMRFKVTGGEVEDPSRVPKHFRALPEVDMSLVKQKRTFVFDYDGGLWTINGRVMDPNRIDAGIEQGSAEIWTFRNGGNDWSHPIHSHFTEFLLLEVNGKPFLSKYYGKGKAPDGQLYQAHEANRSFELVEVGTKTGTPDNPLDTFMGGPRRDVATILPGDEVKLYMRWNDFLGKHVMHCHNVVHEDHAMMIRWDIVEPGAGFVGPKTEEEVYSPPDKPADHMEARPGQATIQEGTKRD